MIDGDNILMLYLYIVVMARIPSIFAYLKMIQEFSTTYVRSISKYGYCMTTLEIALERIISAPLKETVVVQKVTSHDERSESFANQLRQSIVNLHRKNSRTGSIDVTDVVP